MRGINEAMATTLAACGDVNRNVMAAPTPATSPLVDEIQRQAKTVSDALLPKTRAYHQIWVEGTPLKLTEEDANFVDPLYGKTYLPRKFKVAFAIPPLNDVDVLTNDCGFVAIIEKGRLAGYNLTAGGGMGMSHGNSATYARLADVIGFVTPDQVIATAKAVVTIHRDFGDRTNRKHARLKYVIAERGVEWFRAGNGTAARVSSRGRRGLLNLPGKAISMGGTGNLTAGYFLGLFVQNGRIKDDGDASPQERVAAGGGGVPAGIAVDALAKHLAGQHRGAKPRCDHENSGGARRGRVENQGTVIARASIACPALPTCGLALAESERAIPEVLKRIEQLLAETGLKDEEIIIRMTGCPNGCARPLMAEMAFVGRAPGKYQLYLGGNVAGTRLGRLYKESVKNEEFVSELRPLFERFAKERLGGERFGDFSDRVLLKEAPAAREPAAGGPAAAKA